MDLIEKLHCQIDHVHFKRILSICESLSAHTPLPTLLSHSLVQSSPAPHGAAATPFPFRFIYGMR